MNFAIIRGKEKFIALAKENEFTKHPPDPITEPGEIWFHFGDTEAEAMYNLSVSLALRRLNVLGKMRIPMKLFVKPSEILPNGYGVAYWEYDQPVAVCYPVPINLMVRIWRWFWHQLILYRPTKLDKMLRDAYDKGHKDTKDGKYIAY